MCKGWSKDEEQYLIDNYETTDIVVLANKLCKSERSISSKAFALGLRGNAIIWTNEKDDLLRELYESNTRYEISKILNCTESQVKSRLKKLGIKKEPKWKDSDIKFLCDNFSTLPNVEIGKKLNKSRTSVSNMAKKYGLVKEKYWNSSEIEYLKSNFSKIPANDIANKLNRSKHSIRSMAYRIGLKHDYDYLSEDDIMYIEKHYPNTHNDEICSKLNIGRSYLDKLAKELNLIKDIFWKEDDIEFLINNYVSLDIFELMNSLNRTEESIHQKATALGLKRNFSSRVEYNDVFFDSNQELMVYLFIENLNIEIKKNKEKFNYSNIESYIPDFIINENIIVEFYGMYKENPNHEIYRNYNIKTHNKNKYYNSLDDYDFIAIYPEDLKNDFEGVYNKVKHLIPKEKEELND